MHQLHYHTSTEGQARIALAALTICERRNMPHLAGDTFCQAMHESREDRRTNYSPMQVARFALRHVLEREQRQSEQLPTEGGDSTDWLTRTDPGSALIETLELASDAAQAINDRTTAADYVAAVRLSAALTAQRDYQHANAARQYNGAHRATAQHPGPLAARVHVRAFRRRFAA